MQRKPIANKYRKGTMKSTLNSTQCVICRLRGLCWQLASSKGSERESEIALQKCFKIYACCLRVSIVTLTHTHTSCTIAQHLSAKYNRTERLLHLFDGSGLLLKHLITTWLHALLCISRRNYPTRLETRTKEFNWIASRRVNWTNQSWSSTGVAKANLFALACTM